MHKVDHDVKCQEFYGLIPPRFCGEIKTVVYNEFLTATKTIKEKLLEVDGSKADEVHSQLSLFLDEIVKDLDSNTERLLDYFYQNYTPGPGIPLYGEHVSGSEGATERVGVVRRKLAATNRLNKLMMERIDVLKLEIGKRHRILATLSEQKKQLNEMQVAKENFLQFKTQSNVVLGNKKKKHNTFL